MEAKEVELRGKALSKAMAESEPSASLLTLLNELKKGVHASEELLRKTKIGHVINRLRQHKDPSVAKLATELVGSWREQINKQKKKGTPAKAVSAATNGTSSPAPAPSGTQSPAPNKKKHSVDPTKRNHKTDKVDYRCTGEEGRDNCIRLMYDGLAFQSDELPSDVLRVAKAVESAAYSNAGDRNNEAYRQKMRSLFQNLKNKSNADLGKRVLTGDITPKRLVTMSHDELKSAERRAADDKLKEENMMDAMVAQVEKSVSTEFQCGKCKQRQVAYSQAQTRSADEPMTTFCECMNCGNRWKFS